MDGPVYRYIMRVLIIPFDGYAAGDVRECMKWIQKTNIVLNRFNQQCRPENQSLSVQVSHPTTQLKIFGK